MKRHLHNALLRWYDESGRDLPWRRTRAPYCVWVAEVMLQQTQVDRVVDYYRRFLKRFPTVTALSRARWPELLARWRGLGYYGRARNMLKAAKAIVAEHRGRFPRTVEGLEALPGIGPYTARAVAVFAYEADHLVLDTNTKRVLGRALGLAGDDIKERLMAAQARIVPKGKAWPFHQALMDLGATICAARDPRCGACPLKRGCTFRKVQPQKPDAQSIKNSRRVTCHVSRVTDIAVAVIHRRGKILIAKRPAGHLKGCWEFPGGKRERGEDWRHCLKREVREELGCEVAVRPHDWEELHHYKDRSVRIRFHRCSILRGEPTPNDCQQLKWVDPAALPRHRFLPANARVVDKLARARWVDPHA